MLQMHAINAEGLEPEQKAKFVAMSEANEARFADCLQSWTPGPRLIELVGEDLPKRDKRRIAAVVQQYQFDPQTPADTLRHWMELATREVREIAPHMLVEWIPELWAIPVDQLFAVSGLKQG